MTEDQKALLIVSGVIGFFVLSAVALAVLKTIGVIGLSWLWVLSPIWLPLVLLIIAANIFD